MDTEYDTGLEKALSRMLQSLTRLAPVDLPVDEVAGLVAAADCVAKVDCPSASTSLKDGYAVVSADVESARPDQAVELKVCGTSVAGGAEGLAVKPGSAVKIMTGAMIPRGADAVIANEFTIERGDSVSCLRDAHPGRNILKQGFDVTKGEQIVAARQILRPAMAGMLAAGGLSTISVHPKPRVGIIATGDEVVAPGNPLKPGQLYASNLVALVSWLGRFQIEAEVAVAGDRIEDLSKTVEDMFQHSDVLLTSGGAWKSDRDLTVRVFEDMGGETIFHRVRIGPGKAVALILVNDKAAFCLPGGPPSNEMAFLQIALPGLLHLGGRCLEPFEHRRAILTKTVRGQEDWTQFLYATIEENAGQLFVSPIEKGSRLRSQAKADALIKIPEGTQELRQDETINVQLLFGDSRHCNRPKQGVTQGRT